MPYKDRQRANESSARANRRLRRRLAEGRATDRAWKRLQRVAPPRDDLIWAAGIFEGEGTVTISGPDKAGRTRPFVMLTSTDSEITAFFHERWRGCLRRFRPTSKGSPKPATCWSLNSFEPIRAFLLDIMPHIRTARVKAKVGLVLQDIEDRQPYVRRPDAKQRSAERAVAIRGLNRRGMPPLLGYSGEPA